MGQAKSSIADAFRWSDAEWRGRSWSEAVLYELHIGTFTPEGTFRAAIGKLDHLQNLGVTAVELMCICAFAGQRSWGYDGVQLYAPNSTYGRPEDLKAFIDAAHARNIMVILDVVYNHFGPEGNYIPKLLPADIQRVPQDSVGSRVELRWTVQPRGARVHRAKCHLLDAVSSTSTACESMPRTR